MTRVEPDTGSTQGGQRVTIFGKHFKKNDKVYLGEMLVPTTFDEISPKAKTATHTIEAAPAHGPGRVSVTVISRADGLTGTRGDAFTFACPPPSGRDLLLLILVAGALGGCMHALWSLRWHVAMRDFKYSWMLYYCILPFTSSILGMVFSMIVRAGFFAPQGTDKDIIILVGLSAIVGLYSPQGMEKLKQVADAVLSKAPAMANPPLKAPAITAIDPAQGPNAGNTPVTLRGSNFVNPKSVTFGGTAAKVVSVKKEEIVVLTPSRAVAEDVEVAVEFYGGDRKTTPVKYNYT